jgi:probable phosphoglycerate mutase
MGYIYFTRHGQSLWNIEKRICGATDVALSDLGREQATALGRQIRQKLDAGEREENGELFRIDEILYSPLSRTTETAQLIAAQTGIPSRPEMRIIEQDFGRYEGLDRELEEFSRDKMRFFYDFDGGETMARCMARVYNLMEELEKESRETGKIYLLVAHNGIARGFESWFREMTIQEYANGCRFGNCELIRREFV